MRSWLGCLDLGRAEVVADIFVNGNRTVTLWKPPYPIGITNAVRSGSNDFEMQAANLWPNRLIGDEESPQENEYLGADTAMGLLGALFASKIVRLPDWRLQGRPKPPGGRVAFATWKFFAKGDPLYESGLLGPVRLRAAMDILARRSKQ